jgi:hypothetical protein
MQNIKWICHREFKELFHIKRKLFAYSFLLAIHGSDQFKPISAVGGQSLRPALVLKGPDLAPILYDFSLNMF